MPIVGGLDIHRKQLTFDYLDTETGEVKRGHRARGRHAGYGSRVPSLGPVVAERVSLSRRWSMALSVGRGWSWPTAVEA